MFVVGHYEILTAGVLLVSRFFQQSAPPAAVPSANQQGDTPHVNPWLLPPAEASLGWPLGQKLDMHVYLSTSPNGGVFDRGRKNVDEGLPHFAWENIIFGDFDDARAIDLEIRFPDVRI